jgi:hypothetical protein
MIAPGWRSRLDVIDPICSSDTSIAAVAAILACIIRVPDALDISTNDVGIAQAIQLLGESITVPKRAPHGRSPKNRNRARRAPPPPRSTAATAQVLEHDDLSDVAEAPRVARTTPRSPPATPVAARRAATTRRTTATAVNYAYLGRDVRALGMLAPGMIVLLVLAFIFLH